MIDYVVDAIEALPDAPGITVSDVRGWGHPKGDGPAQLEERVKLETVIPGRRVDEIVNIISEKGRTGNYGDGKIFITDIEGAIRIRTGERGADAV